MADLLYEWVGVDGQRKRKQREIRSIGVTIDGYTDKELRAGYCFGKEFIQLTCWQIIFVLKPNTITLSLISNKSHCFALLHKW